MSSALNLKNMKNHKILKIVNQTMLKKEQLILMIQMLVKI